MSLPLKKKQHEYYDSASTKICTGKALMDLMRKAKNDEDFFQLLENPKFSDVQMIYINQHKQFVLYYVGCQKSELKYNYILIQINNYSDIHIFFSKINCIHLLECKAIGCFIGKIRTEDCTFKTICSSAIGRVGSCSTRIFAMVLQ